MCIEFNFNPMGVDSSIEVCFFYKTIEKSNLEKKRIKDKEYFKTIKKLKEDTEYNYYFIYSYELDISESEEKYSIHNLMSIYIGKGNIFRALQFKRDFQVLKTYKRIIEKMIVEKKILHIYRTKKNTSINLSKAVDNIILTESRLISAEIPFFNKKDNGLFSTDKSSYFSEIKNILRESETAPSINRFKTEIIANPNNILGILEEKKVFDSNFSKEDFFSEFIKPYKTLKIEYKI